MPGIITSRSTMSHWPRSQISSASTPFEASDTSKYSADSRTSNNLRFVRTSSTTRIRALIPGPSVLHEMPHRLEEFGDRNRLRQIRLAAALADPLLVALHGEGRHRHHRDRLQLVVLLDPFGD